MIDIKDIREHREKFEQEIKKKTFDVNLDHLLEIDETRIRLLKEVDELRTRRNEAAKKRDIELGKEVKEKLEKLEASLTAIEIEFKTELYKVPNPPLPEVPVGKESSNKVLRTYGTPKKFSFKPKDHIELGEALGIIDIERAGKVSGSRFAYIKGDGALLELALINFAIKTLTKKGFTPIFPPALIRPEMTEGLGYWQAGGNANYYLAKNAALTGEESDSYFYLVGTAEHSVVPMYQGEVINEKDLPKKYVAFSPAFRSESGSYGKDVRGILRVHQFDKIEMVAFVTPELDEEIRRDMLSTVEGMMQALDLPYQVVALATGDTSFPAAETIDIETWIPSQEKYRETHSISTTTDFQSQRLNIKYNTGSYKNYVHILNGTAFAIGRMIIAILENYQNEDGSVTIPEVLREYFPESTVFRNESV